MTATTQDAAGKYKDLLSKYKTRPELKTKLGVQIVAALETEGYLAAADVQESFSDAAAFERELTSKFGVLPAQAKALAAAAFPGARFHHRDRPAH